MDIMKKTKNSLVILPIVVMLTACAGNTGNTEQQAEQETTAEVLPIVEQIVITEEETTETTEEIATPTDTVMIPEQDGTEVVMINQLGHRPEDQKLVVVRTDVETEFSVINSVTGSSVYDGQLMDIASGSDIAGKFKVGTFTAVTDEGSYYISSGVGDSGTFRIGEDVYQKLYEDMLTSTEQDTDKPDSDLLMDDYLISQSKELSDLLIIYESGKEDGAVKDEILKRLDRLMEYSEDEVVYGENDISKRAIFSYAACLIRGAEDFKDVEGVSVDSYRERAVKVWESINNIESLGYISDNADYREAAYYAAVEFYKAGEIGGGELADMDVSKLAGGLSTEDLSGYGMFSLIDSEEGTEVSEKARKRLEEITKEKTEIAEWDYLSPTFYGGQELPKPETVSEQGMFFFLAEKVSDDERIPVLAKRQLDYLLGENDEGICYIKKYGYHTVSEETVGTRNTSLLYILSRIVSEESNSEETEE